MIRELTIHDLDEASKMVGLKPRTSGTSPVSKGDFLEGFSMYFAENDTMKAFGYFENNELICFVCVGFFESKMRGKFWVIPALYTKNFKQVFNFKDPDMALLLKFVFEYAENNYYYEFYYTVAERIVNAYERQWQRNSVMPVGRYDLITLDKVPANTKPEFELYWRLMGEEEKPDAIVIKKRVLKEQYRKSKTTLYTPLNIPRIEPNNWDEWWEIWNTSSAPAIKVGTHHNSVLEEDPRSMWKGLVLYRDDNQYLNGEVYQLPLAPQSPVVNNIVKQITEAFSNNVHSITVLENLRQVPFHTDSPDNSYHVSTILWSTNTLVNWILLEDNEVHVPKLPEDTNTFAYLDNPMQHCAIHYPTHSSGVIQIKLLDKSLLKSLIKESTEKYKGLVWEKQIDK
jgi:hypothetical protein